MASIKGINVSARPLQPGIEITLGNVKRVFPNHKCHEKTGQGLVSTVSSCARTSRNQTQLVRIRFKTNKRKWFVTQYIVGLWKSLPKHIVGCAKFTRNQGAIGQAHRKAYTEGY